MQQSLSPKKYIETKARSLPIDKCLVNSDWKESKMASVVVMRRHVNGNVTAGIYLVDLLCLGIKDTFFMFNSSLEEIMERFSVLDFYKEVEYKLAHNIIYAGHDFAMEFDIHPHKDFATTRFLLEEDNNTVPLVDIEVGDRDGKPHLMVSESNRFPEALAKLKKNAGEGNYYYTIGMDTDEGSDEEYEVDEEYDEDEDDEDGEYDDDDDEALVSLDDIPVGRLNLQNVQTIKRTDLIDLEKIKKRTILEHILLRNETFVYTLPDELDELTEEEEDRWEKEWNLLMNSSTLPNDVSKKQVDESNRVLDEMYKDAEDESNEEYENRLIKVLNAFPSNPILVSEIYETCTFLFMSRGREKAKECADKLCDQYPAVRLSLALGSLVSENQMDPRFENIYRESDIRNALPGYEQYYFNEIINFWLLRLWVCLEENNLKDAIQYLYLVRHAAADVRLLIPVLVRLNADLGDYYIKIRHIGEDNEDNDSEYNDSDDFDADDKNDDDDKTPGQNTGGKVIPF